MSPLRGAFVGAVAGAVGTLALNATTYADMAIRARPASSVPAEVAGKFAEGVGVDLSGGDGREAAQNRRSGLGALFGIATGLGVGAAYRLVRSALGPEVSRTKAGVVLGLAARAADVPSAALGVTDPTKWGANA